MRKDLLEKLKHFRNSKLFSNITTTIIIVYACVLGFGTIDELSKPYGYVLYLFDWLITIYFLVEIVIKMITEEKWTNYFKSGWNIFDFTIVALTLIPLENSSYAAIARLMRVFRILRLFNARPELKRIIDMLIKAIPSIIDIVILMFIILYIYAIMGSIFFGDLSSSRWDNFLSSMLTLFGIITFDAWTDVMYETMEVYPWAWAYFVSFVIISGFVFFNLFVAVIIDKMQELQNVDTQDSLQEESDKIDRLLKEVEELKELIKLQQGIK